MKANCLSIDYLKSRLSYDPLSGVFTWIKTKPKSNRIKGDIAGSVHKLTGYISINLDGIHYKSHRLAWFYINGEWPKDQLDHIDHVRTNNSISNLREVSQLYNNRNKSLYKNNIPGKHGVIWNKLKNKWECRITIDKKRRHIGYFKNIQDAIKARIKAESGIFHKNHGETI